MTTSATESLVRQAVEARTRAIAPYSNYKVGAALEDRSGTVHQGCNIENASYGLSVCAERVALLGALSSGVRDFARIAVVTDAETPATPCGPCRQLLWEYCGDIDVVVANLNGFRQSFRMSDLLPHPFDLKPEA